MRKLGDGQGASVEPTVLFDNICGFQRSVRISTSNWNKYILEVQF